MTNSTDAARLAAERGDRLAARSVEEGRIDDLFEVVAEYRRALETLGDDPWRRAEIDHNLGTAFCRIAQETTNAGNAVRLIEKALTHLQAAVTVRTRRASPVAWGLGQANLAIAHLTRFIHMADAADLMAGHVAIEGAREVFRRHGQIAEAGWADSIRSHLVRLGERRRD